MNHHLIKDNQILAIEKIIPKELYSLSVVLENELPASRKYFWNIFPMLQVEWKEIYLLPSINWNQFTYFQYKILSNILYLNKQLFVFNKKDTRLCSYCRLQDEATNHIFVECKFAIKLWSDLWHYFKFKSTECHFWFFGVDHDLVILLNHMLQLYKYYICSSRDSSKLLFAPLFKNI